MIFLDYKKVNISKIIYQEPEKVKGDYLISKTYYSYNKKNIPIYIQTPKLRVVNDLVNNGNRSFLELELDSEHINFYEFITNVDDNNITITHENSFEWFEKKLPHRYHR